MQVTKNLNRQRNPKKNKRFIFSFFLLITNSVFTQYLKIWEGYNSQNVKSTFYKMNASDWVEKTNRAKFNYFELSSDNGEFHILDKDRSSVSIRLTENSCYYKDENTDWTLIYKGKWIENTLIQSKKEISTTSEDRDPRPKDQANVFWDGKYYLYSFISDEVIIPNSDGEYVFYGTTNEDPTPHQYKLKIGETKAVYKFVSYDECIDFCNQIRKSKGQSLIPKQQTNSLTTETADNQYKREGNNFGNTKDIFNNYVSAESIGKNLVSNNYIQEDKVLINNVNKTVYEILNKTTKINIQLKNIRSILAGKDLKDVEKSYWSIKRLLNDIATSNYLEIENTSKLLRILNNDASLMNCINKSHYKIYFVMHESGDMGYYIWNNISKDLSHNLISDKEKNKLLKNNVLREVNEVNEVDFLFSQFGLTQDEYYSFEPMQDLIKDSMNLSTLNQDILGYTYIGNIKNNKREGYGILINIFQDTIYKGTWSNDMPLQGKFYQYNYQNKCFGNCQNGFGLKIQGNDEVYKGDFKNSLYNGNGEIIWRPNLTSSTILSNKSSFSDGLISGLNLDHGAKTIIAEKIETPELLITKFYNGQIFFFQKQEDNENYKGFHKCLIIYVNGTIFNGYLNFDSNIKNGTKYFQDGNVYIGSDLIYSDKVEGEGIKICLNSNGTHNILKGVFENGEINGMGAIYYANGKVSEGLFNYGELIKTSTQIEEEKAAKIEEERLSQIEKDNKENEKKRSDGLATMEFLAMLIQYQKEYENSPEGKAKKYQLENYCGWCDEKIGERKFKPCYDGSREQEQCYSRLYDKPSFFSYEYGEEFFCKPECAIKSCQNKH